MLFKDRLVMLMAEKNIQCKEMAPIMGVSPNHLSMLRNGRKNPSSKLLTKLSEYFDVSEDFMRGVVDTRNPGGLPDDVKNLSPTGHLSGLYEYRECCYSCRHLTILKHKGHCHCRNQDVKHINTYRCIYYSSIDLMECEICHMFVRALGAHVRVHKITAERYKEIFGYNRTTGLVCSTTKELLQNLGTEHIKNLNKYYETHERKSTSTKGIKFRDEGRLHIKIAKLNMSDETRKRMSDSQRGLKKKGHAKSAEWREKLSRSHKNRLKNNVKRTIIRDSKGRIISYKDSLLYWKKLDNHWRYRESK